MNAAVKVAQEEQARVEKMLADEMESNEKLREALEEAAVRERGVEQQAWRDRAKLLAEIEELKASQATAAEVAAQEREALVEQHERDAQAWEKAVVLEDWQRNAELEAQSKRRCDGAARMLSGRRLRLGIKKWRKVLAARGAQRLFCSNFNENLKQIESKGEELTWSRHWLGGSDPAGADTTESVRLRTSVSNLQKPTVSTPASPVTSPRLSEKHWMDQPDQRVEPIKIPVDSGSRPISPRPVSARAGSETARSGVSVTYM